MSRTVITRSGLNAAVEAARSMGEIQIVVASFKIGSAIITPVDTLTDVVGLVHSGGREDITHQIISPTQVTYTITLDETVGDFNIGNVGLFLADGSMLAIVALDSVIDKTRTADGRPGNRRVFNIPLLLSNTAAIASITTSVQEFASLPSVADESGLPNAIITANPAYIVRAHTETQSPFVAAAVSGNWYYSRQTRNPFNHGIIKVSQDFFAHDVNIGDGVSAAFILQAPAFYGFGLSDGTDASTGFFGIRGEDNTVHAFGSIYRERGRGFIPGETYYAGESGAITTAPSSFVVGVAMDSDSMLVTGGFNSAEGSLSSVAAETDLPAASLAPHTAYRVNLHSEINRPALALPVGGVWHYIPVYSDIADQNALHVDASDFRNADIYGGVYYDVSGSFAPSDGLDSSKGFLGIRAGTNVIYLYGSLVDNPDWNLSPGQTYYAAGGGNAGRLTTTENRFRVGVAVTPTRLLITGGAVGEDPFLPGNAVQVDRDQFAPGLRVGAGVYRDRTTNLFELSDGEDNAKGFFGIRGANNYVYTFGSIYEESGRGFIPGQTYYAAGGGNAGNFTAIQNNAPVGIAITPDRILLTPRLDSSAIILDAASLPAGIITSHHIAADAVTRAKMAHGSAGSLLRYSGITGTPSLLARGNALQILSAGDEPGWITPADLSIADASVASFMLDDDAITTSKFADNSITLAKMAHGDEGDIIIYATGGVPARFTRGETGQQLIISAAGTPEWRTLTEADVIFMDVDDESGTTAKIANNSVSTDKMAHGTRGDIIRYVANGVPSRLNAGVAGQALSTDGTDAAWGEQLSVPIDLSVDTDAFADNSVTLAKLEHGDAGRVGMLYYHAVFGFPFRLFAGQINPFDHYIVANYSGGPQASPIFPVGAITESLFADGAIIDRHFIDGSINAAKIMDDSVITANFADLAVNVDDIENAGITADQLFDGAVTESKIQNSAVTNVKIHSSLQATSAYIENNSIIITNIGTRAVEGRHFADRNITGDKILDGNLATNTIIDGAVRDEHIRAGEITGAKIRVGQIQTAHILNNSIDSDNINDGTVTSAKLTNNSVTLAKMAHRNTPTTVLYSGPMMYGPDGVPNPNLIISAGGTQEPAGAILTAGSGQLRSSWRDPTDLLGSRPARAWGTIAGGQPVLDPSFLPNPVDISSMFDVISLIPITHIHHFIDSTRGVAMAYNGNTPGAIKFLYVFIINGSSVTLSYSSNITNLKENWFLDSIASDPDEDEFYISSRDPGSTYNSTIYRISSDRIRDNFGVPDSSSFIPVSSIDGTAYYGMAIDGNTIYTINRFLRGSTITAALSALDKTTGEVLATSADIEFRGVYSSGGNSITVYGDHIFVSALIFGVITVNKYTRDLVLVEESTLNYSFGSVTGNSEMSIGPDGKIVMVLYNHIPPFTAHIFGGASLSNVLGNSYNVASLTDNGPDFTVTFTNPLTSANYSVLQGIYTAGAGVGIADQTASSFKFSNDARAPFSFAVFGD